MKEEEQCYFLLKWRGKEGGGSWLAFFMTETLILFSPPLLQKKREANFGNDEKKKRVGGKNRWG